MCGIWSYIKRYNGKDKVTFSYETLFNNFMKIKHRGPDMSSFQILNNIYVGFHRLAIMAPTIDTNQPYIIKDNNRTILFICNGEIYNFKELINNHKLPITDNSDCMTIPQLYIKFVKNDNITDFVELFKNEIKGEYAFILYEFNEYQEISRVVVGRDEIGIRPLYYHDPDQNSDLVFSSEIKGLDFFKDNITEFNPGMIMDITFKDNIKSKYNFSTVYDTNEMMVYKNLSDDSIFNLYLADNYNKYDIGQLLNIIKLSVVNSVHRRLTADKPIAFLLSCGVDSSLVAGIAAKKLGKPINTYCCGMNDGTDLQYARKVAEYIGSNHTEVLFTPEEGLAAIRDVIRTTETWDTTTIRASVGQYLVSKHIGTKTDAKVVLVGEGPDEVCSSYLFNYYAPNGKDLHNCALEYVRNIHMYDGKRADRCISRWGLEGRIALLDPEFIKTYWNIPAEWRHPKFKGMEKWWLRRAFEGHNIIPSEVLWRKKEAFSDGVSGKEKSWFEILQDFIKTQVTMFEMEQSDIKAPTLEAYYYKKIFIELFGKERLDIIPDYWQPKWINNGSYVDPSARVLNIYSE